MRRTFSICAVRGQAFSLLGRLKGLGAGAAAAEGRRSQAAQQENLWRRQRLAQAICVRQARCVKKNCIIGREGHPQPGVDLFHQISDQKVRTGLKRSNVFEAIYSR